MTLHFFSKISNVENITKHFALKAKGKSAVVTFLNIISVYSCMIGKSRASLPKHKLLTMSFLRIELSTLRRTAHGFSFRNRNNVDDPITSFMLLYRGSCWLIEREYWYEAATRAIEARIRTAASTSMSGTTPPVGVARGVVLFVGDGMGMSTLTAARILSGQRRGNPGEEAQLVWDSFPAVALARVSDKGNNFSCFFLFLFFFASGGNGRKIDLLDDVRQISCKLLERCGQIARLVSARKIEVSRAPEFTVNYRDWKRFSNNEDSRGKQHLVKQ